MRSELKRRIAATLVAYVAEPLYFGDTSLLLILVCATLDLDEQVRASTRCA